MCSMEMFLTVTKMNMNKKDSSLTTYWWSFWKDPGDSPKQPKQNILNITHYQEDNTGAILWLKGHDYRKTEIKCPL